MYPIISLFGLSLGTYGICCVIGGALAIWLAIRNGKRFQQDRFAMLEACVWALIGGFLGAKLLYLLVSFSDIMEMFQTSGFNWNTISSLLEGGFVFYGGLLGGLAALLLYLHHFQLPYGVYLSSITPAIPLAHAFGRIGCFFAGCCYGKPVGWGIAMQQIPDVPRIPIQLIEAGCLLVIFTGLLLLQRRRAHAPALRIYLISYAVCRFALEFFRGDELRGIWLGRSTSQWISLAIILYFALAALLTDMNHRIHHTENWRKMNNEKENSNSNSIMRGMSGDTSEMSKDGVRQKYRDSER